MRKKLLFACLMAVAVAFTGCDSYDDSEIVAGLENAEDRLDALEDWKVTVEEELASLQTIIDALEDNDYVTDVEEITSDGEVIGYEITFAKYGTIKISNGTDGTDGEDGASGTPGAAGTNGEDGDSIFSSVDVDSDNSGYIEVTLSGEYGGGTYYIPMTTKLIVVARSTGSSVSDKYYYTTASEDLEFTISDLPEDCVAVNAKIMGSDGTWESTVVTRADSENWTVTTAYEDGVATITVKTPTVATAEALLKITAVGSNGSETAVVFSILPPSASSNVITDTTDDQLVTYSDKFEGTGNTIELPTVSGANVTINLAGGFESDATLSIVEAEDATFEGNLYLVVDNGTDLYGDITIDLPSATVYFTGNCNSLTINGIAQNTLYVTKGSKIAKLNINIEENLEKVSVYVEGEVTDVVVSSANNAEVVNIITSGTATVDTVTNSGSGDVTFDVTDGGTVGTTSENVDLVSGIYNSTTEVYYQTLKDAVLAAAENNTIKLGAGEFMLTTDSDNSTKTEDYYLKIVTAGLTIEGVKGETIIYAEKYTGSQGGNANTQNVITVAANNVTLKNLTVYAHDTKYYYYNLKFRKYLKQL